VAFLYRGVYYVEHSRIKSLEERVNVLVFAHGPLLVYALTAHRIEAIFKTYNLIATYNL
jgi:aldehyde:ferredoxin oxidoreductase